MYEYIEFKNKWYCKLHKVTFDKDSVCSLCDSSKSVSPSNFTNNLLTITNKSRRAYVKRSITERFHSYRKKFDAVVDWDALFQYEEVLLNNNVKFKRINLEDAIVRVFRKSILVTIRSSMEVKGLDVKTAESRSKELVMDVLSKLPKAIRVKDSGFLSSVHNAFINHPFAKKDVKVKVNDEVRFISDNSHGNPEFEAVNPQFAISDSEAIEEDMKCLIDKGISREFIADSLVKLVQDREYYADNLKSHVQAIKDLNKGIIELNRLNASNRIPLTEDSAEVLDHNSPPLFPLRTYSKEEYQKFRVRKLLEEYGWGESRW